MRDRKRRSIIFGGIAFVGVVLIVIVVWLFLREHRYVRYEDFIEGYSLEYPSNWEFSESKKSVQVLLKSPKENKYDTFQESINIVVQDLSSNPMSIKDYTELAISQIKATFKHSMVILESKSQYIDGRKGHKIVVLGKSPGRDVQVRIMWTINGLKAYQITYIAEPTKYEKFIEVADKIAQSFEFI